MHLRHNPLTRVACKTAFYSRTAGARSSVKTNWTYVILPAARRDRTDRLFTSKRAKKARRRKGYKNFPQSAKKKKKKISDPIRF